MDGLVQLLGPNTAFNVISPILLHLLQEGVLLNISLDNPFAQLLVVRRKVIDLVTLHVDMELVLGAQSTCVDTHQIWGYTKALGPVMVGKREI